MFLILTTKPGQFRTEVTDSLRPCEAYDYLFYGQKQANFLIAELSRPIKIRVIDEAPPPLVNEVPSKFFPTFETLDQAREELAHLTRFGSMDIALERTL